MTSVFVKRLQKELHQLRENPIPGIQIQETDSLTRYFSLQPVNMSCVTLEARLFVIITGAPGTVYDGEVYKLKFEFPSDYPINSPEVWEYS